MSFRAVAWAFDEVRGLSATEKLVLLALAEFSNDDNETWRSREEIGTRAECSIATVERAIARLKDTGLVALSGRYVWCDRDTEPCSSRQVHKHRSGTTYMLNLDASLAEKSTTLRLRDVAETAQSREEVHNPQIEGCESTPLTSDVPHPSQVRDVLSINPQLNPQPDLTNVVELRNGLVRSEVEESGLAVASRPADGRFGDAKLISQCLPAAQQVMDASEARRVAAMLRARVEAGWKPDAIRKLMDKPLPEGGVNRMGAFVAHRLEVNVDPSLAPISAVAGSAVREVPRVPWTLTWRKLVWDPTFAEVSAKQHSPGYDAAVAATKAELIRAGLSHNAFHEEWQRLHETGRESYFSIGHWIAPENEAHLLRAGQEVLDALQCAGQEPTAGAVGE